MKYDRDSLILSSSTLFGGFLLGAALGMLFTPYSGTRMRRRVRFIAEDWFEGVLESLDDVVALGQRVKASGFQKLAANVKTNG
jgi:hypothetical protein